MKKPELLAPAGNFRCLTAAVNAGADAVYFGLEDFNMRQSAENFSIKDLEKINKICGKVKKYLTLNTIVFDSELEKIEETIRKLKGRVDAIICWDMSVIQLCKKYKIPFHVSTQASIANKESAKFYKDLGAERIILARELNLEQIKEISKIINVEVFVHGAMCVSISGRCFTSQFLFKKSANRGECLHPCRRAYKVTDHEGNELKLKNNRVMSAKDLCTLPFIEELKNAGISAFKIEGRNRQPEYVDTVTRVYRKAIDKKLTKKDELISELESVYNRDFSSGFYLGTPTSDDFTGDENGSQKKTKVSTGVVDNYFRKQGVAAVNVQSGELKINDEIIVTGDTTFFRKKIKSMEIDHKKIDIVKKGQAVGIKLPLCRVNDKVYLVVERTKRQ
ncbi:MAG: U32 family peptidase [Candidatus Aenigmarchaeota archaeon]|nr:U32 family peptidase [Candidatus Aenigmarchaeota archaeon]